MRCRLIGIAVLSIVLALVATPSRSQDANPAGSVYVLGENATYRSGCFGPCLCPIVQAPVRGTLRLTSTGFDGLYNTFDLSDVSWAVNVGGSGLLITGSGEYKLGGEVALLQQLELDLVIAGNPVQHFDSGLVPAGTVEFPLINVVVSMNHMFCHDTVFAVDAAPGPGASIPTLQQWALMALGLLILLVTANLLLRQREKH